MPNRLRACLVFLLALSTFACERPPESTAPSSRDWSAVVADLTEQAWERQVEEYLYLQVKLGRPITRLTDLTPEHAREQVAQARALLAQIERVPTTALEPEEILTLGVLRHDAELVIDAEPFYWLTFPFTPYLIGYEINAYLQMMGAHALSSAQDRASYLHLVDEYADLIDQLRAHVEGQVERGIYLSKPALSGIAGLFRAHRDGAVAALGIHAERAEGIDEAERDVFVAGVAEALEQRVVPAFDAFLAVFESDAYQNAAPETVGLAQYPNGEAYYRYLVHLHTTLDVTPEQLHERGLRYVEALAAERAAIRKELGFTGTQAAFHQQLQQDPRFLARTPEEVETRYLEYVQRIEPHVSEWFSTLPEAPYGVRRLDAASEGTMTYGYYEPPNPIQPKGLYLYNGSHLEQRSQVGAGPLIYHELIPGHHFQVALQNENESLPMYRRESYSSTAFIEGWANYAAHLAVENGLLEDPYERYAWACFDTFVSVRLVVDTGMNLKGWSLEQARAYMREHLFRSETEIASESLRYSTGIPGQALAYKTGFEKILELRRRLEAAKGADFDIRKFHDAVLGSGVLPLQLLEEHLHGVFGEF